MSDIDEKLREIIVNLLDTGMPNSISQDEAHKQIKQAFADAGYSYQERNLFKGLKLARTVMTGQEWYERFDRELDDYADISGDVSYSDCLKAAKRAAGL